jgi:hypothetical protein
MNSAFPTRTIRSGALVNVTVLPKASVTVKLLTVGVIVAATSVGAMVVAGTAVAVGCTVQAAANNKLARSTMDKILVRILSPFVLHIYFFGIKTLGL